MNEIEHAIARAKNEYRDSGYLSLTTVMELAKLGLDVPSIENRFETEEKIYG